MIKPFFSTQVIKALTDQDRLTLAQALTELYTSGDISGKEATLSVLLTLINAIVDRDPNLIIKHESELYGSSENDYAGAERITNAVYLPDNRQGNRALQYLHKLKNRTYKEMQYDAAYIKISEHAYELIKQIIL